MFQRELSRIAGCVIVGVLIGVVGWIEGKGGAGLLASFPFYVIGLFYGAGWILRALPEYLKTIFQASVFIHNLWGVAVVLLAIFVGLPVFLTIGWLAGLVRAVLAVHEAWEADQLYGTKNTVKKSRPRLPEKNSDLDDDW